MRPGEAPNVCRLVREVFNESISQEFEEEGRAEFFRFANPDAMRERVQSGGSVLVASQFNTLLGVLEFAPTDRIAMLFVRQPRRGVAKTLLAYAIGRIRAAHPALSKLTVHSSRYAEPIYQRLGFHRAGSLTTESGITYVPMERDIE